MDSLLSLNEKNFKKEVIDSDQPVLVDFWAPWCAPCQMLTPIIENLAEELKGKVKVGKLNTDEHPTVAGNYGITGIPTLIIFKNGTPEDRIVGVLPKEEIKKKIDNIV